MSRRRRAPAGSGQRQARTWSRLRLHVVALVPWLRRLRQKTQHLHSNAPAAANQPSVPPAGERLITREDAARVADLLIALIAHQEGATRMPMHELIKTARAGDHVLLDVLEAGQLPAHEQRHAFELLQALADGRHSFRDRPSPWRNEDGADIRMSSMPLFPTLQEQSPERGCRS